MFSFSIDNTNENAAVKLHGDLDIEGTEIVEDELIPSLKECKMVDVSFEDVPFVDSSGMGLLLNLVQTLNDEGKTVTISNVKSEVMEVFEMLQIPAILGEGIFI